VTRRPLPPVVRSLALTPRERRQFHALATTVQDRAHRDTARDGVPLAQQSKPNAQSLGWPWENLSAHDETKRADGTP
jgi:hypothetical protein